MDNNCAMPNCEKNKARGKRYCFKHSLENKAKAEEHTGSNNLEAINKLRLWMTENSPDMVQLFEAQLELASTIAKELDKGNAKNANTYRSIMQNIYDRLDKLYGTKGLDVIVVIRNTINKTAEERVRLGW